MCDGKRARHKFVYWTGLEDILKYKLQIARGTEKKYEGEGGRLPRGATRHVLRVVNRE